MCFNPFPTNILFNPSHPVPGRSENIKSNCIFTPLCGASKGFKKTFKAVVKPFEAPQGSVKVNVKLIFILIQLFKMHGVGRVNIPWKHLEAPWFSGVFYSIKCTQWVEMAYQNCLRYKNVACKRKIKCFFSLCHLK